MGLTDDAVAPRPERLASGGQARTEALRSQVPSLRVPLALFILISVADTVSSVYMLLNGMMEEYNPLMRWIWVAGGAPVFVSVKVVLTVVPVWLFRRLKAERFSLVHSALWLTILGYAAIYGLLFCLANY